MKKIISLIAIVFTVLGIFVPNIRVEAADPKGTCTIKERGKIEVYENRTEEACRVLVSNDDNNRDFVSWIKNPIQDADADYNFLAPLTKEQAESSFDPDDDNALGNYINVLIKIIIGLCAVLAVVMLVAGGIEYMMSELSHEKASAKNQMTEAILGLIIALGAYALLNTINPNLLNTEVDLKMIVLEADIEADVAQTPVNGKYANGATYGNKWDDTVGLNTTLPPRVTVKEPQCTWIGQPSCTSIRKLDISLAKTTQEGCGCDIVITGGTESWLHGGSTGNTSHMLGSGTIDLRVTDALNKYITDGKPFKKNDRFQKNGINYYFEGDHWHVYK